MMKALLRYWREVPDAGAGFAGSLDKVSRAKISYSKVPALHYLRFTGSDGSVIYGQWATGPTYPYQAYFAGAGKPAHLDLAFARCSSRHPIRRLTEQERARFLHDLYPDEPTAGLDTIRTGSAEICTVDTAVYVDGAGPLLDIWWFYDPVADVVFQMDLSPND